MNNTVTVILGLALAITMWGMGLNLVIDDFKRVLRNPKLVLLGLINQLILLPIIAFTLISLFPATPEVAVGINGYYPLVPADLLLTYFHF